MLSSGPQSHFDSPMFRHGAVAVAIALRRRPVDSCECSVSWEVPLLVASLAWQDPRRSWQSPASNLCWAAALAIARRGMGFGDAAPKRSLILNGKGGHLVVKLPVGNRAKHECSRWAAVRSRVRETLAGWHRLHVAAARAAAVAMQAASPASRGPADTGAARPRPSSRQLRRSAGVDGKDIHRIWTAGLGGLREEIGRDEPRLGPLAKSRRSRHACHRRTGCLRRPRRSSCRTRQCSMQEPTPCI